MSDWSLAEVELVVADYFAMLVAELSKRAYSKTEHRARLRPLLDNRSDGSIEFKHRNISAVLINSSTSRATSRRGCPTAAASAASAGIA